MVFWGTEAQKNQRHGLYMGRTEGGICVRLPVIEMVNMQQGLPNQGVPSDSKHSPTIQA